MFDVFSSDKHLIIQTFSGAFTFLMIFISLRMVPLSEDKTAFALSLKQKNFPVNEKVPENIETFELAKADHLVSFKELYMIAFFQMHHDNVCLNINLGNKILDSQWKTGSFKKNKKDVLVPVTKTMDYHTLIQDKDVKKNLYDKNFWPSEEAFENMGMNLFYKNEGRMFAFHVYMVHDYAKIY